MLIGKIKSYQLADQLLTRDDTQNDVISFFFF